MTSQELIAATAFAKQEAALAEHMATKPKWWRLRKRWRWAKHARRLRQYDAKAMANAFASLYPPDLLDEVSASHAAREKMQRVLVRRRQMSETRAEAAMTSLCAEVDADNGNEGYTTLRAGGATTFGLPPGASGVGKLEPA